ncbi:MAG: hypothetical protein ACLVJ6_07080 [Merdibacter sp.]
MEIAAIGSGFRGGLEALCRNLAWASDPNRRGRTAAQFIMKRAINGDITDKVKINLSKADDNYQYPYWS